MTGEGRATVVIVTYNSREVIRDCLRSLHEHEGEEVDVILVDNASDDGTVAFLESEFRWVRLHREKTNRGLSAGINIGARATKSEYIFLLNPDTLLTGPLLDGLAEFMDSDRTIGAAGPKILNSDGTLQLSCRRYPTMWSSLFNRSSLLTKLAPGNRMSSEYLMTDFDHASVRDVDWLSGAALMVRRSGFEEVGGMDESYFMYFEDVDLCHRLHDAGYRVVYYPEVELVHHISQSSGRLANRTIVERHRAMWRYWRTYRGGNPLRDAAAGAAIAGRGAAQLAGNSLRGLVR
jgi:N-acetylglucosaminyl-diphospho-decaprenol L-rhamnosyltransferase